MVSPYIQACAGLQKCMNMSHVGRRTGYGYLTLGHKVGRASRMLMRS